MEDSKMLQSQENMYWNSSFLYKRWYRKLYGGTWYLYKFGKDTPYIRLFSTWSKMDESNWSGHTELIITESFDHTDVDTKTKLIKQFFKMFINKNYSIK